MTALPGSAVDDFHRKRPGVTEDLLATMSGPEGSPYSWLVAPLPAACSVLDLACGTAPVADLVAGYVGVDTSEVELAEARRRRPGVDVRLGEATDTQVAPEQVDAVVVSMALMLLPTDSLLDRCAGALPSSGLVTAIVPLRGDAVRATPYGALLDALGELDRPFAQDLSSVSHESFEVIDDTRATFACTAGPDLLLSSFYAPDATPAMRERAAGLLTGTLAYPLRRLVLRRL